MAADAERGGAVGPVSRDRGRPVLDDRATMRVTLPADGTRWRCLAAWGLLTALAGCASIEPRVACPVCEPCRACPEPATPPVAERAPPLQAATWADLPAWSSDDLAEAWPAFLSSCAALRKRKEGPQWQPACEAAAALSTPDSNAVRAFFEKHFRPWALVQPDGTRDGLVTGYYEPILKGSRTPTAKARHPVRAVPDDLLVIDLAELYPELRSLRLRGKLQGRRVVPYDARAAIRAAETAARADAAGALAWVEDPVELFFLHVQGSGRIALPDGSTLRAGYADQNGHPYQSIGRVLIERGELKPGQASMQAIQAWAAANPAKTDDVLNANPSYVFFRELPDTPGGPPGALGVPLQAGRSIAIDPRHVPLGAPVFLATTEPASDQPLRRLMLAQDTGGAIKGIVRADYFWGGGADAGLKAGRMKQAGQMWVLLPNAMQP
jgi:membrane-bound lytic murein transglycosylase A